MRNLQKIKTFRFSGIRNEYSNGEFKNNKIDTEVIDDVINGFIKENFVDLIDIKVTTVENRYHNNGGYNNVDLIYVIIYR